MTNLTKEFGKVNPETELQEMAEKLNRYAGGVLEAGEGMKHYEALTEMQKWFDYKQNYSDAETLGNLVFVMEELRGLFLQLHQYNETLKKYSKGSEVLVEFKSYER